MIRSSSYKFYISSLFTMLLLLSFQTASVNAQLTRGFISGTVSDKTGAVIPGVEVSITNKGTNIRQDTLTNDSGVYRFVAVEPGDYSVAYAAPGFETLKVDNIRVGTTQEVVINQTLVVGAEATIVEVRDNPGTELAKASATIDRKLDGAFVREVPLTGATRDVTRLALMAPTVSRAPGSNEFAANGQRARNNNFTIDGTDNNDLSVTLQNARVIPEAVAEFHVQTATYSAEYGRNSGAQVSIITRSGTNRWTGEVWDYYRGNFMEPVNLLNKRAGLKETPRFVHHQGGFDIGGPIVKDRTFVFGLHELNRRREAPDARNATSANILTPAGFAALASVPLGPGQTPQSRQAVLNALGFLREVHQQVTKYDNPRPITVNGVPIETATILIPLANPYDFYYTLLRFDHRLSEKGSVSYRYQRDTRSQPDVTSNLQFGSRWSAAQAIASHNHALSHTHNIGPRFINEFRFAYVRRNLNFPENDPVSPTVGITGLFTIGGLANFPQGRISNVFQWQDVATYQAGRHSFKIGGDIRRNQLFNRAAFDSKGTWTFAGLEQFLNNQAQELRQSVNEASFDARQTNYFGFFQDDFKVTKHLALNLGLRYEYSTVPFGFFGAATPAIAAVGIPRNARKDKNNWAPRVGFAYSPGTTGGWMSKFFGDGQSVLRGGFGVGYDVLFYNILTVNASNYPRVVNNITNQPATFNLFPNLAPKIATVPPLNPLSGFVNANEDLQNPTIHYWSLSLQRQFKASYILELGYSGNRSYHGIRQGQANPVTLTRAQAAQVIAAGTANPPGFPGAQARRVNPLWGPRTLIESAANAEYHAGYIRFDKRFGNGFLFGGNYTWSATFSDNDESLAVTDITASSPQVPQDFFNYRNEWSRSVFDRPHRIAVHYLYQLPWFSSGRLSNAFARAIFDGWQLAGSTEYQSGQPFTIRTGVDSVGTTAGGTNPPGRPNFNPGGILIQDPVEKNLRTFTIPINGTGIVTAPLTPGGIPLANSMPGGGNLGRNTFRGPSLTLWNISLKKTFSITERVKLDARSDWINAWNHRNFGNPEARMSSPAFGTNIFTGNATDPGGRTMLLSAKIRF